MKKISILFTFNNDFFSQKAINRFVDNERIEKIIIFSKNKIESDKVESIHFENIFSTSSLNEIEKCFKTDYLLLIKENTDFEVSPGLINKYLEMAAQSSAGIIYSDYIEIINGEKKNHPLIDYQPGSIRDDFDFGTVMLIEKQAFLEAVEKMKNNYTYAGLYDLRLKISEQHKIVRIPEALYQINETDSRSSGEKQFDYVNPRNRDVQIEMEKAATEYLINIGAYQNQNIDEINFTTKYFENEASVIIPVKNRAKTISEAVESALNQKTNFKFNVIVVDNFSADGTTEILKSISKVNEKIVHIIPKRNDLMIGGCWSEAVHNEKCGKFSIQLDSDDIYYDCDALQIIVNKFYSERCAMVIGSYILTDFKLNEIPPGIINHKEWTAENGQNNALRVNGLGAPRAFYTPILRELEIPNVSYGEDYFLGITISRDYKIGRIYDPIYICRRWEGNTDAALDINKINENNLFKDKLRTVEIYERRKKNGRT